MAHALTGWTYPGRAITHGHNAENYCGPMIAVEPNHDEGAKTIVGGTNLPAGQTAQQDLNAVLQALATHPNTAPFISLRLTEHLVMSNPSAAFRLWKGCSTTTPQAGEKSYQVHMRATVTTIRTKML